MLLLVFKVIYYYKTILKAVGKCNSN
uniref:Uncharacterized protein n=1 Tax=Arundo donax TaxID=35708 RepID=A0A0A8YB06_ARUDO